MLTTHQAVGVLREQDLRRVRQSAALPVLGTHDTAQVLVQYRDLLPLLYEQALGPLGPGALRLGVLPPRLVLSARHGGVLVQPRHLGADVEVRAVALGLGRPGREDHESGQQGRYEEGMAAR